MIFLIDYLLVKHLLLILKTARDNLATYQLKIVNRPNIGFEVLGNEFAKRQAISDLLIEKISKSIWWVLRKWNLSCLIRLI